MYVLVLFLMISPVSSKMKLSTRVCSLTTHQPPAKKHNSQKKSSDLFLVSITRDIQTEVPPSLSISGECYLYPH
ncbi:hypothetical protein QBC42DRAFT_267868 [Cladorrhinum samala]|uniref:Secreted protein n=1 Tax=Cladorrhinum samala TaxID=585594 RepID=A0AAV9HRL2_9PEZI|nr:hypothetical protein QBC42DRAFT_267868 [Cladorrhinum samala]